MEQRPQEVVISAAKAGISQVDIRFDLAPARLVRAIRKYCHIVSGVLTQVCDIKMLFLAMHRYLLTRQGFAACSWTGHPSQIEQMGIPVDSAEVANRFGLVAERFCAVVDSAPIVDKTDLLVQVYRILPELIGEAISLPDVELGEHDDQVGGAGKPAFPASARLSHEQWSQLYNLLKEN